jgi:hypothetical protein
MKGRDSKVIAHFLPISLKVDPLLGCGDEPSYGEHRCIGIVRKPLPSK